MIKIGIPVVDQHDLTYKCLNYLNANCSNPESIEIIIIDNASKDPYDALPSMPQKIRTSIIRNKANRGYYWPLLQVVAGTTSADLVGLMHNDLFIYQANWDMILRDVFIQNGKLGMVGVCGSSEIDDRGGRGGGTMCNFRGQNGGQLQAHTGKRITDLQPALILDSMFMVMRQPVVEALRIDDHITLCHFMDKLWPIRTLSAGFDIGILGLEVDHMGGKTAVELLARFEKDCERWCGQEYISFEPGKASLALYLESERRFLTEARERGYLPSSI